MNRPISEPGWPEHPERGREIWVRHVQGIYSELNGTWPGYASWFRDLCELRGTCQDSAVTYQRIVKEQCLAVRVNSLTPPTLVQSTWRKWTARACIKFLKMTRLGKCSPAAI